MNSKRKLGRRRFLARLGVGAAGLAASSWLGHWSMRRGNLRLRSRLDRLRSQRAELPPLPGLLDLKGVLHVHSLLSPDSRGTPEEILAAAREAGLKFVMTTDHNSRRIFQRGIQGEQAGLLVIRGAEMIKDGQTILAINTKEFIDGHRMSIQEAVREIKSQGGLVFVAHPWRFHDWDVEGIDGLEIYDIADAAYAQVWKTPWFAMEMIDSWDKYPEEVLLRLLSRPDHHLSTWDRMLGKRKFVGVAGNDAHQNVRFLGKQLDPYALDFRFVRTHVLSEGPEVHLVLDALRKGHAYVSFGLLADATGFRFIAKRGDTVGIMGDMVPHTPGLNLNLEAPLVGRIRLFRDGQPIHQTHSNRLEHPVTAKGIFRSEVSLEIDGDWYPWILSNPIYIT